MSSSSSSTPLYVDDANSTITYFDPPNDPNDAWIHDANAGFEMYNSTLSITETPGAGFYFSFNGSWIELLGVLVPPPAGNCSPPISLYSLDGAQPVNFTAQAVTAEIYPFRFWSAEGLDDTAHKVVVNVTRASADCPYIWDYYECGTGTAPWESTSSSAPSSSATATSTVASSTSSIPSQSASAPLAVDGNSAHSRAVTGAIVGSTVGGVAVIAAIILGFYLWYRRRRLVYMSQYVYEEAGQHSPEVKGMPLLHVMFHEDHDWDATWAGLIGPDSGALTSQLDPSAITSTAVSRPWLLSPSCSRGSLRSESTALPEIAPVVTPFREAVPGMLHLASDGTSTMAGSALAVTGKAAEATRRSSSSAVPVEQYDSGLRFPPGMEESIGSGMQFAPGVAESSIAHTPVAGLPVHEEVDSGIRFAPDVEPPVVDKALLDEPPTYTPAPH